MGDILKPSVIQAASATESTTTPLVKENYLGEFETDNEKAIVRTNLNVPAISSVYSKTESEAMVQKEIRNALKSYVTQAELPAAINGISDEIVEAGYVRSDGTVPFTNVQSQSASPTKGQHLTNKNYVDTTLAKHVNSSDPHGTISKVKDLLANYVKLSDTYTTSSLYSKKELDALLAGYVKKDGSAPFTKPQIGCDPTTPSHLATSRYVQQIMQNHNDEADPHAFLATLNKYLANYYTKSEVYPKSQTYSRVQLLDIIKAQIGDVVDQAIASYIAKEGSVSELKDFVINELYKCIKSDGSLTFTAPQAGVAATKANEFVVLEQLEELKTSLEEKTDTITNSTQDIVKWVTTGPVQTTVGFVEDNTVLPREMTLQQVCDAIFYGRKVGVEAPQYAAYGENVCIEIYVNGISTLVEASIYKNNTLIGTLSADDFKNSVDESGDSGYYYKFCGTGKFTEDTEWKVVFTYSDGQTIVDTAETRLAHPIFVGAVPYWWNGHEDMTIENLKAIAKEDPDNCKFLVIGSDYNELEVSFDFQDPRMRSIVVVLPESYPDLTKMVTPTQDVGAEAFAKWTLCMYPGDTETGVLYKIYVFNQLLVKLNQTVKFYFKPEIKESNE